MGGPRVGMKRLCGRMAGMGMPDLQQSRRGQALLVAVLVLFAVAALAALFAGIIGSQIVQVGRHSDLVELRNIAEAGLNYANEQLTYGIAGADWRPPPQPGQPTQPYRFRCGGGEFTLSVDYGPDPGQVQSRFIRVVSTAALRDNPFLRHTVLALKPVLLTDYARFITDRYGSGHAAALGAPGVELGGLPRSGYVYTLSGPIRSNTDTIWYGASRVDLFTSDAATPDGTWRHLGVLRDDRIEIAGSLLPADLGNNLQEALALYVHNDANPADDTPRAANLFWPAGDPDTPATEAYDYVRGFPDWAGGRMVENTWRVLAELPPREIWPSYLEPEYLAVPRIQPPDVEAVNPDLQINRYLAITRDSGAWVRSGNMWLNTGAFGWGWTRFGGIYIDNGTEIQYKHDLEKLRRNWVGSVGVHQAAAPAGDARNDPINAKAPLEGPADWWDKTGRYYAPPGVEIILHGDALCPYLEIIRHDAKPPPEDPYYWQDPSGNPITVSSPEFVYTPVQGECAPKTAYPVSVNGPRAIFPFPPNGVVYVEGNVRIRGIMPPMKSVTAGQPEGYFGADYGANGRSRRFDLTVVSGGTIYIEGDLLTPRSAGLIADSLQGNNGDLLKGSRLALLARDHVCVNTTAFNPRPTELFAGVPDPDNEGTFLWYNDRYPVYQPGGYPRFDLFQGPRDEGESTPNSVESAQAWDGEPIPTDPDYVDFVYQNVRLSNPTLRSRLTDLRLMMGHSGWYAPGGTEATGPPPEPSTGEDEPAVDVSLQIDALVYPWEHESELYTFLRPADPPIADPANADESGHWYTPNDPDDYLEFLANPYQSMLMHAPEADPVIAYLTGDDLLTFESRVSPVRLYDDEGNIIGWEVPPRDLGYLLGPLAVTPPRGADPLPVRIEAMVYAQNGSWFILPGPWFNEDADEVPPENGTPEEMEAWYAAHLSPAYHEPLNIHLTFSGAITENMPAAMGDVADWTSKWCGMDGATGLYLSYEYDPLLRWSPVWQGTYLRFRNLPLTADLLVWGERISGQAGA